MQGRRAWDAGGQVSLAHWRQALAIALPGATFAGTRWSEPRPTHRAERFR
jgi:hypothetical protein